MDVIERNNRDLYYGFAGVQVAVGMVTLVFVLTWNRVPRALNLGTGVDAGTHVLAWAGIVTVVGALVAVWAMLGARREAPGCRAKEESG